MECSYKLGFLTISWLVDLLRSAELGFNAAVLVSGGNRDYPINLILIERLKNLTFDEIGTFFLDGISIKDDKGNEKISIYTPIPYIIPGVHYVQWIGETSILQSKLFAQLLSLPGFVAVYALSEKHDFLQNEIHPGFYENRKYPIPGRKLKVDEFGHKFVDISGNPGRKRVVRNMILRSCWRMWFGEAYFELIPKQKLTSFQGARISTQLSNGLYFIELYENPFEAELKENLMLQKKFNDHINIEKVYNDCLLQNGLRF